MYNLADFIPYTKQLLYKQHKILVWSRKEGYYFTKWSCIMFDSSIKIIAQEQ